MLPDAIAHFLGTFLQGFTTGLLLNGSLLTLAYFIFWKAFRTRLKNWKIQLRNRVDARQIKRELKNALYTLAVGAAMSCAVLYLHAQGYTQLYQDASLHSWLFNLSGIFVLMLIDDTWFYWCHRLLHHPAIFRYVHAEHHKSVDVNPFSSLSFHFLEPFLLSAWIFPVAFFVPVYAPVLAVVQLWGLLDNLKSHLGYELYPAGLNRSWLRFLTSGTHHNLHHTRFNGNYGVHFRLWDRLLGTEFADYEAEFDRIQARKKQPGQAGSPGPA